MMPQGFGGLKARSRRSPVQAYAPRRFWTAELPLSRAPREGDPAAEPPSDSQVTLSPVSFVHPVHPVHWL